MDEARERYAEGKAIVEENWGFTEDWTPCEFFGDNVWLRMKLDYFEWLDTDQTAAHGEDWKSGKSFGKDVAHKQQEILYVIGMFMRYPSLQYASFSFFYVDENKKTFREYYRDQLQKLLPAYDKRGHNVTNETIFKPRPSRMNCKWCPYGLETGGGQCEFGYEP